jgi:putative SOS response-associated peptidase YedK
VTDAEELKPMLAQFPGGEMQSWPVGKAVGNVRNQGPELIEPAGDAKDIRFE